MLAPRLRDVPRSMVFLLAATVVLAACVAGPASSPTVEATAPSPVAQTTEPTQTPEPSASPQPTPTPSPSPTPKLSPSRSPLPRPSLLYPDVQSHGTATLTLDPPLDLAATFPIACEWPDTSGVRYWYRLGDVELLGELVFVEFHPRDAALLYFFREDRAAYGTRDTDRRVLVDHRDDWATGTIRFEQFTPDPESAPPGPLPSPIDDWVRPIGGDPRAASISGALTWACEPAPAPAPTPAPSVSKEPQPAPVDLPDIVIVGPHARTGTPSCGASWSINGGAGGDSCGPSWLALPELERVALDATSFEVEVPGWLITSWSAIASTQADAERYRMDRPDDILELLPTTTGPVESATVPAPPAGEWSVLVRVTAARGDDTVQIAAFFRIVT